MDEPDRLPSQSAALRRSCRASAREQEMARQRMHDAIELARANLGAAWLALGHTRAPARRTVEPGTNQAVQLSTMK